MRVVEDKNEGAIKKKTLKKKSKQNKTKTRQHRFVMSAKEKVKVLYSTYVSYL